MTDSTSRSVTTAEPLIQVQGLTVIRGGTTICAIDSLTVSPGERLSITGPNGSGKTTLLRVLSGLESDYAGSFEATLRQHDCVLVHQTPFLFRGTVRQNVEYGLAARSVRQPERRRRSDEWLTKLGILQIADRNVRDLSGGERQRAALARAGVLKPRLLLLDEPLADLDETGITAVCLALAGLRDSTIVIASPIPLPDGFANRTIKLTQPAPTPPVR